MKTQVAIVGFGTMGKAIAKAINKKDPKVVIFGIDKMESNISSRRQKVTKADFVILSVKPQDATEVMMQIKGCLHENSVLISIMAGISIKELVRLSGHPKIVRMMPNLGLSVDSGIAAWKGVGLSLLEKKKVQNFLNKISDNFEVKNEDAINKVTAISGSGPAYFFLLADSLVKAASNLGLSKNESKKLVEKTFFASALLSEGGDYASLIKKVASKGGTTEAALAIFEKENFSGIVSRAVLAAHARAKELSHE